MVNNYLVIVDAFLKVRLLIFQTIRKAVLMVEINLLKNIY